MSIVCDVPILGFVAYSGTGKTTLLEKIIPLFAQAGIKTAIIKHAHHDFDIDFPGKDSFRLRKAGAIETLVASRQRWALIHERQNSFGDPKLQDLITHVNTDQIDLILVEGFKHERFPRIELHRQELQKPFLHVNDSEIIAMATDATTELNINIPVLDLNNPQSIFQFVLENILSD